MVYYHHLKEPVKIKATNMVRKQLIVASVAHTDGGLIVLDSISLKNFGSPSFPPKINSSKTHWTNLQPPVTLEKF